MSEHRGLGDHDRRHQDGRQARRPPHRTDSTHARRHRLRHPRQPSRLRGGHRRRRAPTRTSCGASATSSATAPIPTPASRCRRALRDLPGRQPRPRGRRRALARRLLARRRARRPVDEGDDPARDAGVPARALAEGGAEGVGLFHASPRDPVWEYVLSGLTAELCLDATDYRVSLIGHSHVALSFHRPEGEPPPAPPAARATSSTSPAGEWLLNPGGAGQPRDGDPRAAWLMLDTDAWTAAWRRAEYDIAGARRPSARPGCPIRSPSACSTGNEPACLRSAPSSARARPPPPLAGGLRRLEPRS